MSEKKDEVPSLPAADTPKGLPPEYQQALVETVADLDIVAELISPRKEDISRILGKLIGGDRDLFTSKLAELFRKTSALLLVSRRLADSLSVDVLLPRMVELISGFLDAERCTIFLHDQRTDELYTKAAVGLRTEIRFPSHQGIAGAVLGSGQPVLIADAYADPRFNPEIDQRTGFRTRNILCVPIRHTRDGKLRIVGVAEVLNKRSGSFTDEDVKLLDALNSQAAAAFVNALLHEEITKARAEELQLLEVTTALTKELELHPLLAKIMDTAALILEADRATLFVQDPRTRELWAVTGEEEGPEGSRCPSHIEIAVLAFATGETINIPDAYADERFNPELDRKAGYRTRSLLCMPVFDQKGEVVAVVEVLNKRGGPFTAIDEKRLGALSAQASIAIKNARLFQELKQIVRNLGSLLDVSKAMSQAIDLESLLDVILSLATAVMEAERSSLFIHDEATRTLWNIASGALARAQLRVPVGVGIAGHVAETGEVLNIPEAYQDPRFNPEVDKQTGFRTRSLLCAPLLGHSGKLVGVIQVLNKVQGGAFTREDEALLEAFASHAALAVDRAQLVEAFVEKQRFEESLRLAHDIQMAMLPKALPSDRRFELAADLRPAKSVGGDLYDFFLDGDRLWFLVGDVAGKGVAAALFMAVAETSFRASLHGEAPLSVVLSRVNRELCRNSEGAMFVTVFAGCLDLRTGEVVTGNAGHNPPYWLGRGGAVTAVKEPRGVPLGVIDGYEYPTGSVLLAPGEALYLYTDGVTEALNESDEQFSAPRLEAYLSGAIGAGGADLVRGSLEAVRDFVGATAQFDDITVLAVRYLGSFQ